MSDEQRVQAIRDDVHAQAWSGASTHVTIAAADAAALVHALDASRREAKQLRDFADRVCLERDHAAEVEAPTAVADARRAALEEAIALCEERCKSAADNSNFYHQLAAEAGQAGDDVRWRDRLTAAHVAGASATTARELAGALRALLDQPVRPAPASASEEP